jgi:hypothetical protein
MPVRCQACCLVCGAKAGGDKSSFASPVTACSQSQDAQPVHHVDRHDAKAPAGFTVNACRSREIYGRRRRRSLDLAQRSASRFVGKTPGASVWSGLEHTRAMVGGQISTPGEASLRGRREGRPWADGDGGGPRSCGRRGAEGVDRRQQHRGGLGNGMRWGATGVD